MGCGNILFGDDGFGPAVAAHLQTHCKVPDDVCILDVGTGIRDILCTVALSPIRPQKIVAIDTMIAGRQPGEVSVRPVEDFPSVKGGDFSLHHLPTSSILKEMKDQCQMDVLLVAVEPQSIPEEVAPGLSRKLQDTVFPVCDYLLKNCF